MKSRLRASAIHLLGSALVILVFLAFVYFVWYPHPFDVIHSVFDAVHILIGVDLVLGPLLTLIIFDTARKPMREIKRDIAMIVVVQISALAWGVHVTYNVRPEFAVVYKGAIHSVARGEIDPGRLPENISYPGVLDRPQLVYLHPLGAEQVINLLNKMMAGGQLEDVIYIADAYRPALAFSEDMSTQALSDEDLVAFADPEELKSFKHRFGGSLENYMFFPVIYNDFRAIVALDRKSLDMRALISMQQAE